MGRVLEHLFCVHFNFLLDALQPPPPPPKDTQLQNHEPTLN